MFLGLSVLIVGGGVIPSHEETVISLLAHGVFGEAPLYYVVQASAVLILVLAANTAYADFPRLASLLARDDYAPQQLAFRGERLAFSNGILHARRPERAADRRVRRVDRRAAAAVRREPSSPPSRSRSPAWSRHWRRERGPRWRLKAAVNGVGATATGAGGAHRRGHRTS